MRIMLWSLLALIMLPLIASAQFQTRRESLNAITSLVAQESSRSENRGNGVKTTRDKVASKKIVHTRKAPAAIGPYSQAVIANNSLLFTAGQIAINPETGQVIDADIKAQTRLALENLKAILEEAGSSLELVVKTTVFIKDMNEFAAMNEVYGEYFSKNPPARSTVEVARLPRDVRVEIEAVALVANK